MSLDPLGVERRVIRAEIQKKRLTGITVVGYGPGRNRVHTERGADKVIIHSGATTEITRVGVIVVKTLVTRLWIRVEVVPETGVKIFHITGG